MQQQSPRALDGGVRRGRRCQPSASRRSPVRHAHAWARHRTPSHPPARPSPPRTRLRSRLRARRPAPHRFAVLVSGEDRHNNWEPLPPPPRVVGRPYVGPEPQPVVAATAPTPLERLTCEQWRQFEEDGFLRLGQLCSPTVLEGLRSRIDAIMLGEIVYPTSTCKYARRPRAAGGFQHTDQQATHARLP